MARPKKVKVEPEATAEEIVSSFGAVDNEHGKVTKALAETLSEVAESSEPKDGREKYASQNRRDALGLLTSVDYIFDEATGLVDWRKMISPEHLFINKDRFPDGTDLNSLDVTKVDDSKLCIKLSGIRQVAQLRGYSNITYTTEVVNMDQAVVKCRIQWLRNYEIPSHYDESGVTFDGYGEAHQNNTTDFAKDFLVSIAENRAFVRAVRNFLRINVVAHDELGESKDKRAAKTDSKNKNLVDMVGELADQKGITFEILLKGLKRDGHEADKWGKISDIPKNILLDVSGRLKKLPDKK